MLREYFKDICIFFVNVENKNWMRIKLFATDVDGVLTDAGMYYTESGDEFKKFNTRDGMGIQLLRESGLKTAMITGEDTHIVRRRAEKLKIDFLCQGIKDKSNKAKEICQSLNISLEEVAYIGDDIIDIELLKSVGLSACPKDAVKKVLQVQGINVLDSKGGEGAVREFCELILEYNEREQV